MSRYFLGALKAEKSTAFKSLDIYQTTPFQSPPKTFEVPGQAQLNQGHEVYPIDNNDVEGDCTIAGVDHLNRGWSLLFDEPYNAPTSTGIKIAYRGLTGGEDTGLVEQNVLQTWQGPGLFNTKIEAFAPVSTTSLLQWHQSIAFYGGLYLGIECPESAQEQFGRNEPWTYEGSEIEGGHCVVALGYGPNGGLHCATWGGIAVLTPSFLAHYLTEAWVIISQQLVEAKKDTLGLNLEALKADIARI